MRVPIPVLGPAYKNRELKLSAQVTKNLWPEINRESHIALHHTPGLKPFAQLEARGRGFEDFNGTMYTVNGTSLYKVTFDGIDTNLGTIAGNEHCVFAHDGTQLIVVADGKAYKYTLANGLELITDPDLVKPTWVAYLNNQFIFDNNRGVNGEFVTSEISATLSIDGLDFANAESHPDDIVRGIAFGELVYFFGSHSLEVWYNSGVGNPPFDKISGGVRSYGIAGTYAVTTTDEFVYFLDDKRMPRRFGAGASPSVQAIGNPALGVELAEYSKISDCKVFSYIQDHQQFIVYTFPTADRTWVYHEPSDSWFQWSYGVNDARSRANSSILVYGLHYVADHSNGNIYELDPCTYNDNGDVILRERITAPITGELFDVPGKYLFFNTVEFVLAYGDCKTAGLGPGPQPIGALPGVCATTDDLIQNETLLSPIGLQMVGQLSHTLNETSVDTSGWAMDDSKTVSLTFAFTKEVGFEPTDSVYGYIIDFTQSNSRRFAVRMNTSGFIEVVGFNAAGTKILDVTISNNGSSWCDSVAHLFGVVVNLDDTDKREIYVDGDDHTEDSAYVTWTTYTDDFIQFHSTSSDTYEYAIGSTADSRDVWDDDPIPSYISLQNGFSSLGFICLDNRCTLVSAGMWDIDDLVKDPQGDFTGWFTIQPRMAWGPSFWKQAGEFTGFERPLYPVTTANEYDNQYVHLQEDGTRINGGGEGATTSTGETLPDAPTEPTSTLPSPHWDFLSNSMSYNHVNLSSYTNTGFAAVFGQPIEDRNFFEQSVSVNKAIRVNTTDPDQKLIPVFVPSQFSKAAIVLTDASGTIEDWCYVFNTAAVNGSNVTVPADGEDHYLVITSDTGSCTIRMWDST